MTKPFALLTLIILSILTPLADTYIKQAGKSEPIKNLSIAGIMWFIFLIGWFFVYKQLKFTSTGILYSLIYLSISVVIGLAYFHEKLGPSEVIGVILAVIAMILLGKYA